MNSGERVVSLIERGSIKKGDIGTVEYQSRFFNGMFWIKFKDVTVGLYTSQFKPTHLTVVENQPKKLKSSLSKELLKELTNK